jgi:voltage-gated sodium channel
MRLLLNDKFIGLLIGLNALITIYLCFEAPPLYQAFIYADYAITLLFLCEISYKIFVYKKRFFYSTWNIFDFVIVSISAVALVLPLFHIKADGMDFLLIFRTFRLFKFFRIVKIVPNMTKIFSDLKKAVRVTYGIMVGGFVIIVTVGVSLCSIFKNLDTQHFGDPFLSIYSVFRLFSVEGWYEIPDTLCEQTSYINATLIRVVFSFLVLFGMFILGFIISSISDELAIDNNDELIQKTNALEAKIDSLNEKIDQLMHRK